MKRIFTLLLFGLTILTVQAQDYVPMVIEDACWEIYEYPHPSEIMTQPFYAYDMQIQGDTLINDTLYQRISGAYFGFIREDIITQKVYYRSRDESDSDWLDCFDGSTEILLYDFSAELGDTVFHCGENSYPYYVVEAINTIEYDSSVVFGGCNYFGMTTGRYFSVQTQSNFNLWEIREGVGGGLGPLFDFLNSSDAPGYGTHCYKRDCSVVLDNENLRRKEITIYPNPTQDFLMIEYVENLHSIEIYGLDGKFVKSERLIDVADSQIDINYLSSGIYFIVLKDTDGRIVFTDKIVKID